jgi:hypothetical protein
MSLIPEPDYTATFESVWTLMQENARFLADLSQNIKETEQIVKANSLKTAENDHEMEEIKQIVKANSLKTAEIDRQIADVKQIVEANSLKTAENDHEIEEIKQIVKANSLKTAEIDRQIADVKQIVETNSLKTAEIDRQMAKTDRQITRLEKQMGDLHNRFGEIAEHLVAPGIAKRFNELGYHFGLRHDRGVIIPDATTGRTLTEIDFVLENQTFIVAIEIKTKPTEKDISHHIKRMEIFRQSIAKINDQRKILGGIAGAIFEENMKQATRDAGMFVIAQSGDTMQIEVPEDFKPKEW